MFRAYAEGRLRLGGKPKTLFGRIVNFFKSIFTAIKLGLIRPQKYLKA